MVNQALLTYGLYLLEFVRLDQPWSKGIWEIRISDTYRE